MFFHKRKQIDPVKESRELTSVKKRLDRVEARVNLLETTVKVYKREA